MRRGAAWFAGAVLAAGCSGGGHSRPSAAATTPPDAAERLQAIAARGITGAYVATYEFDAADSNKHAQVRVWRSASAVRVDITLGGTTATLITSPAGSWSCAVRNGRRSCLTVAAAGAAVPKPFDAAPVSLFTTDLSSLAHDIGAYDVTAAGADCFDITPRDTASRFASGTYCFHPDGRLSSASFPQSGNHLQDTDSRPGPQPADVFTPYATPSPLPS